MYCFVQHTVEVHKSVHGACVHVCVHAYAFVDGSASMCLFRFVPFALYIDELVLLLRTWEVVLTNAMQEHVKWYSLLWPFPSGWLDSSSACSSLWPQGYSAHVV